MWTVWWCQMHRIRIKFIGQVYVETHTRNLVLVDGVSQTQQCKTHNISARKEEINNTQYLQTTIQNIKEWRLGSINKISAFVTQELPVA